MSTRGFSNFSREHSKKMRIRKLSRQLPACRDSFLPCVFQDGGCNKRVDLEVRNGGTSFSEIAGVMDFREQLVVSAMAPRIIDHAISDLDAIDISRMSEVMQSGQLQQRHVQDIPEWVPWTKVQDQYKCKLPGRRQSDTLICRSERLNFVEKAQEALVHGLSSSPSMDREFTNVDQMHQCDRALYSGSYMQDDEEEEDDDGNPSRHYVRRNGIRDGRDGVTPIQSEENTPGEDKIAAIPKIDLCVNDQLLNSQKKTNFRSPEIARNANLPRSAIPCISNEDGDHPSMEPEGSLLHSLYLQLLAAGREGMSLRGLFSSFATQTSLPRLAHNWREQVKAHLKNGPYFEEVKGRYLLCEFLVQPSSKRSSKRKQFCESPGVQTRRKAFQKTFETNLCESATDFQKQQHEDSGGLVAPSPSMPTESTESDLDRAGPTHAKSKSVPNRSFKSRKSRTGDEDLQIQRNIRFRGAIPGSLKAMQARIIAETGVQDGIRCARKDGSNDSSKWQCPMMAMEGHTLCEHHSFLNERKRARCAKARKHHGDSFTGKSRKSRQTKPAASEAPRKDYTMHDVHSPSTPEPELSKSDDDDLAGLDEVASQALLTMKRDILAVDILTQEKLACTPNPNSTGTEVGKARLVNDEPNRASSKLNVGQFFARSPTGRFIAAKKTAVKIPAHSVETETSLEKSNSPSIRPPAIPPLPAFYGARRKTVKNRSLLSIN